jgi:hypothetical protein
MANAPLLKPTVTFTSDVLPPLSSSTANAVGAPARENGIVLLYNDVCAIRLSLRSRQARSPRVDDAVKTMPY